MKNISLIDEDFMDFPIGEFPYDKNHSAMGEYHFIHYPGFYGRWYDPVCNYRYNGQGASWCIMEYNGRHYMEQMRHLREEIVLCAYFDSKGVFLGDKIISKGSITSSMVVISSVFKAALEKNAQRIVLLHNHPSGDPTPSKQDIIMTRRIKEVSDLIDIPLIDHIVIGDKRYTSFKQKGLL